MLDRARVFLEYFHFARRITNYESCGFIYVTEMSDKYRSANSLTYLGKPLGKEKKREVKKAGMSRAFSAGEIKQSRSGSLPRSKSLKRDSSVSSGRERATTVSSGTFNLRLTTSSAVSGASSSTPSSKRVSFQEPKNNHYSLDSREIVPLHVPPFRPSVGEEDLRRRAQQEYISNPRGSTIFNTFLRIKSKSSNKKPSLEEKIKDRNQTNHFQNMVGLLVQMRATVKVIVEVASDLGGEVRKIGDRINMLNHRVKTAKTVVQFRSYNAPMEDNRNFISPQTCSTAKRIMTSFGDNRHQDTFQETNNNKLKHVTLSTALQHRYEKRCEKTPQFDAAVDSQFIQLTTSSTVFKEKDGEGERQPTCDYLHDTDILKWVNDGELTQCAHLYSFPGLFKLKFKETQARAQAKRKRKEQKLEEESKPVEQNKPTLLPKRFPVHIPDYHLELASFDEPKPNALSSLASTSTSCRSSDSTSDDTSTTSSSTMSVKKLKHFSISNLFKRPTPCKTPADLIEQQILSHLERSRMWQTEKASPRRDQSDSDRLSIMHINDSYYSTKQSRERLFESITNYRMNKYKMEELLDRDCDSQSSSEEDDLSSTGSVVRIPKANHNHRASIDSTASALSMELTNTNTCGTPSWRDSRMRPSIAPYYDYLTNKTKYGNNKARSPEQSTTLDTTCETLTDEEEEDEEELTSIFGSKEDIPSILLTIEKANKARSIESDNTPLSDGRSNSSDSTNHMASLSADLISSRDSGSMDMGRLSPNNNARRKAVGGYEDESAVLNMIRIENNENNDEEIPRISVITPNSYSTTSDDDRESVEKSDSTFDFGTSIGPITTLTDKIPTIEKMQERVTRSRPLIQQHMSPQHSVEDRNIKKVGKLDNTMPASTNKPNKSSQQTNSLIVGKNFVVSIEEDEETDESECLPRIYANSVPESAQFSSDESGGELEPVPFDFGKIITNEVHLETPTINSTKTSKENKHSLLMNFLKRFKGREAPALPITQQETFQTRNVLGLSGLSSKSNDEQNLGQSLASDIQMTPSECDLSSSFEYSLKVMEDTRKKIEQGWIRDSDSLEMYYDDDLMGDSYQSRYIPSNESSPNFQEY